MTTWRVRVPKAKKAIATALEIMPLEGASTRTRRALRMVERNWPRDDSSVRVIVTERLVRVIRHFDADDSDLFGELVNVIAFQLALAREELTVRGAIAVGDVESRADFAAGPALEDADRLRELADVPRVLLAPSALAEIEEEPHLRRNGHPIMDELRSVQHLLRLDSDGLWFVDYLGGPTRGYDSPWRERLEVHRVLVERGLQSAKTLNHESRKWTWLFTYHNRVVNELHAEGLIDDADRSELRIPAKSPLVFEFPPEPTSKT